MKKLTRNEWIAVAIGLVVIGFYFFNRASVASFITGPIRASSGDSITATKVAPKSNYNAPIKEIMTGLTAQDLVVGVGAQAIEGSNVTVHYIGTLVGGQEFDNSYKGLPLQFVVGDGRLIAGFDKGVIGMKVGGKRKITIAPDLAYGAGGVPGVIPPSSTLVFEIELFEVK